MKRSLDELKLTPCPLAAEFQEAVSHCKVCGRDVLDLSSYTREEAARLLSVSEPPCVRFVVSDGKPVFREKLIALGVTAALAAGVKLARHAVAPEVAVFSTSGGRIAPSPPPVPPNFEVVGGVIAPPTPPAQRTGGVTPPAVEWH